MSKRLEYITKAQAITDKAFEAILNYIKPGMSDAHVARKVKKLIIEYGGDSELAFPTLVCSGKRTALFHGPTSAKKIIATGEPIYIDMGAKYRSYCADMTRTFFVGKPDKKLLEIYNAVLNTQNRQIKMVAPGVKTSTIDQSGRDFLAKKKLSEYFIHSTGHGIGTKVHQRPRIHFKSKALLKEGDVITIEPGVYIPDCYGVRIEDLLIVTKNGYQNLTKSSKKVIIL